MNKKNLLPLLIITFFAIIVRFYGLGYPDDVVGDEVFYIKSNSLAYNNFSASSIAHNKGLARPPLGKLLIHSGIKLFGNRPFGWRVMSALFGSLTVLILFYLALMIGRSRLGASVAALYLAFDPLHISLSRTGMLDSFMTLFLLLAIFLFVLFQKSQKDHWAVLSAFSIGLAASCKWNAIYVLPIILLLMLIDRVYSKRLSAKALLAFFIVTPISYLPIASFNNVSQTLIRCVI